VRVREITLGGMRWTSVGWGQAKGTCDLPKDHSAEQENVRDIVGEKRREGPRGFSQVLLCLRACVRACVRACMCML
jgi:hypothetical protein